MTKLFQGRLEDKVALISGAARGIGASTATLFAEHGAKVIIADIIADEGQQLVDSIQANGGTASFIHLDVTRASDWQEAISQTLSLYGKLDILLNNAGILRMQGVEEETLEGWNHAVSINQTGVFLGMKYAIPVMKEAGGSIINLSSIAGLVGTGVAATYHATKGAVRTLTKTAAVQYAKDNIRINSMHPGLITTRLVTEGIDLELRGVFEQVTPMGREGTPNEVANGALFLASDESSYMTGAELVLDGGLTAH